MSINDDTLLVKLYNNGCEFTPMPTEDILHYLDFTRFIVTPADTVLSLR